MGGAGRIGTATGTWMGGAGIAAAVVSAMVRITAGMNYLPPPR
jgi:hypothetical protein